MVVLDYRFRLVVKHFFGLHSLRLPYVDAYLIECLSVVEGVLFIVNVCFFLEVEGDVEGVSLVEVFVLCLAFL